MATVTSILNSDGKILYEIERSNWGTPTVRTFDPRGNINLSEDTIIDILLLGEGYLSADQASFENHISSWYDNTFAMWPYSDFTGAFRVRAVFTPSDSGANTAGDGYFGITLNSSNDALDLDTSDADFREQLFDVLEFVRDNDELNTRSYPGDLTIGQSGDEPGSSGEVSSPRSADTYQNLMRNCVVGIAVKNTSGNELSGFFGFIDAPPGHDLGDPLKVSVAFGRGYQHEFSHAFGLMLDEYIHDRGTFASGKQNPSHPSVFEMWNLSYTGKPHMVPWFHLSPDGLHPRTGLNRVGQMWKGGRRKEKGVWHSEYKCQMNGGHQNYFSRTDEPDRLDTSGDQVFASLRRTSFCLWCTEILIVKILEKTDAFLYADDLTDSGGDFNILGQIWHRRWVEEMRAVYWVQFDLPTRIDNREGYFQNPANLDRPPYFDGDLSDTNLMTEVTRRKKRNNSMLLWNG